MQLLETNGIDIQVPKEEPKVYDLTGLINFSGEDMNSIKDGGLEDLVYEDKKYNIADLQRLINEYLEYYIFEIRDAKLCNYLHKEISWFVNEYTDTYNNVQVFFTSNNNLWVRVEMWKDFETWEYYLTHLLKEEYVKPVYETISFYIAGHSINNTSNGLAENKDPWFRFSPEGDTIEVKGKLTIGS